MTVEDRRAERVLALRVPDCEAPSTVKAGRGSKAQSAPSAEQQRRWVETLGAVQQIVPGAVPLRTGVCAMRARGPARYYGGEEQAARALIDRLSPLGMRSAIGVACGVFAAELASRIAAESASHEGEAAMRIVDAAETARFLDPLPIGLAVEEELAEVLIGLGVRTLGAFAALPEHSVLQRFGRSAMPAHRRASGLGEAHGGSELAASAPVRDLSARLEFETPLEGVDQLAFACGTTAEGFTEALREQGLVCTELRIELHDDLGARHERLWSHPANFTASDVVNRIRWQASDLPRAPERGGAGISAVSLFPQRTAKAADHEAGLWSDAPDERVHHQLTRVQSLVGHDGVGIALLAGGRVSTDRQLLLPWGEPRPALDQAPTPGRRGWRQRDGPWPGRLPGALPNTVFSSPPQVRLLNAAGESIRIDADELLGSEPRRFGFRHSDLRTVREWSAPWPLRERWWAEGSVSYRLQLLLDGGEAWLLRYESEQGWVAEGCYA